MHGNVYTNISTRHHLVRQACALDLLHDSQHGSIPRRTAMDPIMLTQLTTDLCCILKHDLARFDNDASACYDRIIVALGMLAARRCGMPKNAIRLHSEALQFMRYTVKTMYGISEANYHGTVFEPLFGTGQGSGASPAVWLSLVVLLHHTFDRIVPHRMKESKNKLNRFYTTFPRRARQRDLVPVCGQLVLQSGGSFFQFIFHRKNPEANVGVGVEQVEEVERSQV